MTVSVSLYAAILRAVARVPRTTAEVATIVDFPQRNARRLLNRMHSLRLVHVAGWAQPVRGLKCPQWLLGDNPDEPRPVCQSGRLLPDRERKPLRPRVVGVELMHLAAMLRLLENPTSVRELCEETGRMPSTMYANLKRLRRAGLVRIAGYDRQRNSGAYAPLWVFAIDRPNAPRPKTFTQDEILARHKQFAAKRKETIDFVRALASPPPAA